jgi:plastocyanin
MQDENHTPIVSSGMSGNLGANSNKKLWLLVAAAAVIVLIAGVTWAILAHQSQSNTNTAKQTAGPTVSISISGMNPATIKIKPGQEVTWTNQDTRQHQLTADQSQLGGFDSIDPLLKGDSYTFTFDNKGTFHYYDPADPKTFNGTVVVSE